MSELLFFRPTVAVSASPDYSAGDFINTGTGGYLTLSPFPRAGAKLVSVVVRDAANQSPALKFLFLRSAPAATLTDNGAFSFGSGDVALITGQVEIRASDYLTTNNVAIANLSLEQMHEAAAQALYVLIIANGAYNAAATTDLSVEFHYERATV